MCEVYVVCPGYSAIEQTGDLLKLDSSFQLMGWVDKMTADIFFLLTLPAH